jgi:hypothetical protein
VKTHDVWIPDGESWIVTMTTCQKWIKGQWPDIISMVNANEDWDYDIVPEINHVVFCFKDPSKAILFKLTHGGA